jgi:hypothetical protein
MEIKPGKLRLVKNVNVKKKIIYSDNIVKGRIGIGEINIRSKQ